MVRRVLPLAAVLAFAAVVAAPSQAASSPRPVPSLTRAKTQRLWTQLVQHPRFSFSQAFDCVSLRAVFYAPTDWLRLATKLAANPSPCAQYLISIPPLAADKTQFRGDQAWRVAPKWLY